MEQIQISRQEIKGIAEELRQIKGQLQGLYQTRENLKQGMEIMESKGITNKIEIRDWETKLKEIRGIIIQGGKNE